MKVRTTVIQSFCIAMANAVHCSFVLAIGHALG